MISNNLALGAFLLLSSGCGGQVAASDSDAAPGPTSLEWEQKFFERCVSGHCVTTPMSWEWSQYDGDPNPVRSTLTDCWVYRREKVGASATLSCQRELQECTYTVRPDGTVIYPVIIADLNDTIALPDVQAALKSGGTFGQDRRSSGHPALHMVTVGEKSIRVGEDCGGASDCVPLPVGVRTLITQLKSFDSYQVVQGCPQM